MLLNESFCQNSTFCGPSYCNLVCSVLCGVMKPHINQVGYVLRSDLTLETDPARQHLNLGPLEVSCVRYGLFGGIFGCFCELVVLLVVSQGHSNAHNHIWIIMS